MKTFIYFTLLSTLLFAAQNCYAGTADREVLLLGCDYGEGEKACWVNVVSPIPGAPQNCNTTIQLRWKMQSASGADNTGEELFAMALTAANTGNKLRINVDETTCYNGSYPLVKWMSLIPNSN